MKFVFSFLFLTFLVKTACFVTNSANCKNFTFISDEQLASGSCETSPIFYFKINPSLQTTSSKLLPLSVNFKVIYEIHPLTYDVVGFYNLSLAQFKPVFTSCSDKLAPFQNCSATFSTIDDVFSLTLNMEGFSGGTTTFTITERIAWFNNSLFQG